MKETSAGKATVRRSHFAPFRESLRPWLVLARNAVPVIGVYKLGWSAGAVPLLIWFDGATALGAMLAFQVRAFASRDSDEELLPQGMSPKHRPLWTAVLWLLIWLLLGIPYWFLMLMLGSILFESGSLSLPPDISGILVSMLTVLLLNISEEARRGYGRMSADEQRREFNWDFSMHLARVSALLLVLFFLRPGLVIGIAAALSYVEIYPMRTLRFLDGVHALEIGNQRRSRD